MMCVIQMNLMYRLMGKLICGLILILKDFSFWCQEFCYILGMKGIGYFFNYGVYFSKYGLIDQ